jgi:hypothetical protein
MSKRSLRVVPVAVAALAIAISGPSVAVGKNGADDPPGHENHHKHKHHHHHHHGQGADDGAKHN